MYCVTGYTSALFHMAWEKATTQSFNGRFMRQEYDESTATWNNVEEVVFTLHRVTTDQPVYDTDLSMDKIYSWYGENKRLLAPDGDYIAFIDAPTKNSTLSVYATFAENIVYMDVNNNIQSYLRSTLRGAVGSYNPQGSTGAFSDYYFGTMGNRTATGATLVRNAAALYPFTSGGTALGDFYYNTDNGRCVIRFNSGISSLPDGSYVLLFIARCVTPGDFVSSYPVNINNPSVGGTATADVETAKEGDTVTVTCTPSTGYAVSTTQTSITSTVAVLPVWDSETQFHFTMPGAEVTINPVFASYHNISVEQVTGGTCTVSTPQALPGATITATLNPAADYSIDTVNTKVKDPLRNDIAFDWVSGTRLQFTMPQSDVTVYPAWTENLYYSITIGKVTGGTITASKTEGINPGETVRLTCVPNSGYTVDTSKIHAYMGIDSLSLNWIDETHCELTMPPTASTILTVIVTGAFRAGNPYSPGGDSDGGSGGGGTYDGDSDAIPIPDLPIIQMTDTGMLRLFKPTSAQVKAFGDFLWSDLISWESVTKLFTDPIESVISFHMLPITPDTGVNIDVKFMGVSSGVSMPPVTNQYQTVHMGGIQIEEYYGSFLDYSPLTRISLYLPYVGETEINTDEVMGKALSVYYRIDVLSGSCIAYVTVNGNVMYQYSGNCLIPVPLSQANYARIIGAGMAIVNTGLSMLSGAGTMLNGAGGALSGLGGMLASGTNTVRNGLEMASPVTNALQGKRAGGHASIGSGISGLFGVQYPYVTITRPKQSLASGFNHFQGYPANISGKLSEQTGYIKINSIDLTGITATEGELSELRDILRGGIYV